MVAHERRRVSVACGVEGDFRGKPGRRQVTVLAREAWEAACADVGRELGWTTRRANLLVEGVELTGTAGQQLRIGALVLVVTEECDPCRNMDRAFPGLRKALGPDWRGGVCCRVEHEALVTVGDEVVVEAAK